MGQTSLSYYEYSNRKKRTKRDEFLEIMDEIIPWDEWVEIILPFCCKGQRGRPPKGVKVMLRMYLLQCWFHLTDEGVEDAIYDSYAFRKFMGINFLEEDVPDATTLLHFRYPLEKNGLNKLFFDAINRVAANEHDITAASKLISRRTTRWCTAAPDTWVSKNEKRYSQARTWRPSTIGSAAVPRVYQRCQTGRSTGSGILSIKSPLCAVRRSMPSASSSGSLASGKFHIEDWQRTRTGFTLCPPVPISMCWFLPREVPARHNKGAVCPF